MCHMRTSRTGLRVLPVLHWASEYERRMWLRMVVGACPVHECVVGLPPRGKPWSAHAGCLQVTPQALCAELSLCGRPCGSYQPKVFRKSSTTRS